MQISVTLVAQEGLNWSHWQRLAAEVENLGCAGLFRSDHFPGKKRRWNWECLK